MNCVDGCQGKEITGITQLNLASLETNYYSTALQVGKQPSWLEQPAALCAPQATSYITAGNFKHLPLCRTSTFLFGSYYQQAE